MDSEIFGHSTQILHGDIEQNLLTMMHKHTMDIIIKILLQDTNSDTSLNDIRIY